MADTGNTATWTFGTTSFSVNAERINGGEKTLESIEDSHLGTTGNKTFIPSDLTDDGEIQVEFQYDGGIAEPALGAVETGTMTFPILAGDSAGATLAGTGFLTNFRRPTLENGQKQMGSFTFKWDGKTGPTFTAGS